MHIPIGTEQKVYGVGPVRTQFGAGHLESQCCVRHGERRQLLGNLGAEPVGSLSATGTDAFSQRAELGAELLDPGRQDQDPVVTVLECPQSLGGLRCPSQHLVAGRPVFPRQDAQPGPALGDLFEACGLDVQRVQISGQVCGDIGERIAGLCQPARERRQLDIVSSCLFQRFPRRGQPGERAARLVV